MLLKDKKIAIIGGGPGGLTLARLLQLQNAEVTVYERDADRTARLQGGALDLHTDSGLAALEKAGLLDAFKTHYRPGAEKIRIVDNQGNIYFDQHAAQNPDRHGAQDHDQHTPPPTTDFGDPYHRPEIDRGPLRDILLDSLHPGTVIWNSHILSLTPLDNAWQLQFANGTTAFADIVIGADGASSRIRPYVTDIKPLWAGVVMIEGALHDAKTTAPHIHDLLKGGKIFAFGNEHSLIVSSKGDGSFGFAASFKADPSWIDNNGLDFKDHRQMLAWFKKEFPEWSPIWHELFNSDTTLFIPRPQYCMPLDQSWEAKPNITLVGDAAHWMPPFAGEGVNMAMRDALELSISLTGGHFPNLQSAIAAYEKQMFSRFAETGQMTLSNTEWMHGPDALNDMLQMFSDFRQQ